MSENEQQDQELSELEEERDRLIAGCRATADWLEAIRADYRVELLGSVFREFQSKAAELRRLFLPRERFGDGDSIADRYGSEEG